MPSTESVIVKESGFDLGFAVLIDAFVIRNLPVSASPRPARSGPTQGRTSARGDTMGSSWGGVRKPILSFGSS